VVVHLRLWHGACVARMAAMGESSIEVVCCDPPYGLTGENGTTATGFLGQSWDRTGIVFDGAFWSEVCRVLVPGGRVKVFGSPRTFHRVASAMEGAALKVLGLEAWAYSTGFPKSLSIDKAADALSLFGSCDSRALSKVEQHRPVIGHKRRLVSRGRRAAQGESRPGVKSNMERWLNYRQEDIPITRPITEAGKLWEGWGTALKPAWEPILVGMKPC